MCVGLRGSFDGSLCVIANAMPAQISIANIKCGPNTAWARWWALCSGHGVIRGWSSVESGFEIIRFDEAFQHKDQRGMVLLMFKGSTARTQKGKRLDSHRVSGGGQGLVVLQMRCRSSFTLLCIHHHHHPIQSMHQLQRTELSLSSSSHYVFHTKNYTLDDRRKSETHWCAHSVLATWQWGVHTY